MPWIDSTTDVPPPDSLLALVNHFKGAQVLTPPEPELAEVGDHSHRITLTATSASDAVMSGRTCRTVRTASSVWLR